MSAAITALNGGNGLIELWVPGQQGAKGETGGGVAAGGVSGQKLRKSGAADYVTTWVDDYDAASQADAEAGSANDRWMTPLRTRQHFLARLVNTLSSTEVDKALTAAQGKALADGKADKATVLAAGAGLTGGGDLSAARTIAADIATQAEAEAGTSPSKLLSALGGVQQMVARIEDTLTSTSNTRALSAAQGKALGDGKADKAIQIATGSGLTGGGDLSASRTLTADFASQAEAEAGISAAKVLSPLRGLQLITARINNTLTSTATDLALSAAQGKVLADGKAPLASPVFTGTPQAPTATFGTDSTQLATTSFVQQAVLAAVSGLKVKDSCVVATTGNITLSGIQTIDGIAGSADSRVLAWKQTAGAENGLYLMKSGAWVRTTDFDENSEVATGAKVFVQSGTLYGNAEFTLTSTGPFTLGVTPLNFTQTSGAGQIIAGNGLSKSGNTLALAPLTAGQILLGNGSNVATAVAIGGAFTLDAAGTATLAAGVVGNSNVAAAAGIVDTKLATISTAGKVANSATTATSANTASAIVARDASGNFSAGTITAALSGNASTATKLATARAINGVDFDGTAPITITAASPAALTAGSYLTGTAYTGSTPQTWSVNATFNNTVSTVVARDANGDFAARDVYARTLVGNASTATKLATPRTINGVAFDGSANIVVPIESTGGILLRGAYLTGSDFDGSASTTWAVDATPSNTASKVVARDGLGNFSAGTITANLTGTASGNLPYSGGTLTGLLAGRGCTGAIGEVTEGVPGFQVNAATTGAAAYISFSRAGAYGVRFGLDTDNQLKVGGWFLGANAYTLLHSANFNTYAPTLTGTGASGTWGIGISGNAATAAALQTPRLINGVSFNGGSDITITAASPQALTAGSFLTGGSYTGSAAVTLAVDATSANTANKVVARDALGNFSAGTITATLNGQAATVASITNAQAIAAIGFTPVQQGGGTGQGNNKVYIGWDGSSALRLQVDTTSYGATWPINISGSSTLCTGNAYSATLLQTPRLINGVSFDGGSNITIKAATPQVLSTSGYITGASFDGSAAVTLGLNAGSGNVGNTLVARDVNGDFSARNITATNFYGTATSVASVTSGQVTTALGWTPVQQGTGTSQLTNAIKIGWSAGSLLRLQVDSTDYASTWPMSISGNAATATKLATARNINGVAFDGTSSITITANTPYVLSAGSYLTAASSFNGSQNVTFAVDATSANTASKVVARDGSGSFSANVGYFNYLQTAGIQLPSTNGSSVSIGELSGLVGNGGNAGKMMVTLRRRSTGFAFDNYGVRLSNYVDGTENCFIELARDPGGMSIAFGTNYSNAPSFTLSESYAVHSTAVRSAAFADASGNDASTPNQIIRGRAKVLANFNGTGTPSSRQTYNVSSVVRNGSNSGDYFVNFTSAVDTTNMIAVATAYGSVAGNHRAVGCIPQSSSQVRVITSDAASTGLNAIDSTWISLAVFT